MSKVVLLRLGWNAKQEGRGSWACNKSRFPDPRTTGLLLLLERVCFKLGTISGSSCPLKKKGRRSIKQESICEKYMALRPVVKNEMYRIHKTRKNFQSCQLKYNLNGGFLPACIPTERD